MNRLNGTIIKTAAVAVLLISPFMCIASSGTATDEGKIGNFIQLTPNGGILAPVDPEEDTSFSAIAVSNNGTLYAGTNYGAIYQVINANSGFSNLGAPIIDKVSKEHSVIALGAKDDVYDYVRLDEPSVVRGTGPNIISLFPNDPIYSITLGINGVNYYGTLNGNFGVSSDNDKVGLKPVTLACPAPGVSKCKVAAVGVQKNSPYLNNSIALQFNEETLPKFNAKLYGENHNVELFAGEIGVYDTGDEHFWAKKDSLRGIAQWEPRTFSYTNNNGEKITTTKNVQQWVTSMLVVPETETVYVGTNLFNVFTKKTYEIGTSFTWAQVNDVTLSATLPDGTNIQDGSIGITTLGMVNNNELIAIGTNSPSVITAYKYDVSAKQAR